MIIKNNSARLYAINFKEGDVAKRVLIPCGLNNKVELPDFLLEDTMIKCWVASGDLTIMKSPEPRKRRTVQTEEVEQVI